jgi:multiple sugar transport system substrate-binding protein
VPWQPKTWADIISAAQKIKASGQKAWPMYLLGGTAAGTSGFQYSGGPLLLGSDTPIAQDPATGKWVVDSPGLRQTFGFYSQLAEQGLQAPSSVLLDPNSVYNQFQQMASQKMAIILTGNWLGDVWTKDVCAPCWPEASKIMGPATIPTVNGTGNAANAASTLGGWDLAIGAKSAYPSLAWDFIETAEQPGNLVTGSNWAGWVPPDKNQWTNPQYTQFAPPYQKYFAKLLPYSTELNNNSNFTIWATGFTQATGAIIQNPSTSVNQAISIMKSYVTGQLGADKVETKS